jgi:CheY-like chemotaxis protein
MNLPGPGSILHVNSPDQIDLRDQILKAHGYSVVSTTSLEDALKMVVAGDYSLVLIDVQAEARIPASVELCGSIKQSRPKQKVAFVCNYRVSVYSDCPDEVIRSEFNPGAMVEGIKAMLEQE